MNKLIKTPFSCKRDGLTINGNIYASNDSSRNAPAVILSHGFLCNQKMCIPYAKKLAERGYRCFVFDFCGGGLGCSSYGKSEEMTLYTEREDLLSVIQFVNTNYLPISLSLLGCSQGGVVSAMVAALKLELISKLILFYPALCIPDDARNGKMMFYCFDPQNIPNLLGKFPMKLGGNYARCVVNKNIYEEIKGYDGPVLLLHGDKDSIVKLDYAIQASKVYPHCEFHIIHKGTHMFKGKQDKEATQLLLDFMKI